MPALHNDDGSVSVELYNYDSTPYALLLSRTFTKDEWAELTREAREAGTTVFVLLRERAKSTAPEG